MALLLRGARLRLAAAALPGPARHMSLLPAQARALLHAEVPALYTPAEPPLAKRSRRADAYLPPLESREPAELEQRYVKMSPTGRHAFLRAQGGADERSLQPELVVASLAELRAGIQWLSAQAHVDGRPPVRLAASQPPLLRLSRFTRPSFFDVRLDIDAARAPNNGVLGPEMRLSPVYQRLADEPPRQVTLPPLVLRVPIDVSPLLAHPVRSFAPLGEAPAEPSGSDAALQQVATAAAERALEALTASDWARSFPETAYRAFKACVQQLVTLYWKADGERFTINLGFALKTPDGAKIDDKNVVQSKGTVLLNSAQLDFDDFAANRQPKIKALSRDANEVWPPVYAEAKKRGEKAARAQERREREQISTPPEEPLSEARQSRPSLRRSAYGQANSFLERLADEQGLVYRQHMGNIGLFGYGAGMGMGTFDGVVDEGGHVSGRAQAATGTASTTDACAAGKLLRRRWRCVDPELQGGDGNPESGQKRALHLRQ
jgi:hypothetical protein